MKDQIIMSRSNGEIAIAVPLYRIAKGEKLENLDGYSVLLVNEKPTAYAVDCGLEIGAHLVSAEYIEANVEFLGEL